MKNMITLVTIFFFQLFSVGDKVYSCNLMWNMQCNFIYVKFKNTKTKQLSGLEL